VFAAAARKKLKKTDDVIFTTIKFAGGCVATVENSWVLPENFPLGLQAGVQVVGTKGIVIVNGSPTGLMVHGKNPANMDYVYTPSLYGELTGASFEETRHFIKCVRKRTIPQAGGEAGRAAVQVVIAAQQSIRTGKAVKI
jgi:predicted dehydrogenase